MPFYTARVLEASRPADESQLSRHTTPIVVTVPPNASENVNRIDAAKATSTTSVGDAFISASKAVAKGVSEFTNQIADAAGKVQSGIAQAQSAAADPVSFVAGLAQQATGVSIPSSPQGIVNLLAKFSKPKTSGDGRTDIANEKSEGESIIDQIGDTASLTAEQLSSKISAVSEALSPVTEIASSVTQLASLGGVPVDNVISQSINQVTSPVQSTLTKVQNVTDGTQGIIT